jgi:hypothetical protein
VFKNLQTILRSSSLDKTNVRIFKQASGCNKASFGLNEILEEKRMRSHLIQKFFYFSSKILSIKELSLKSHCRRRGTTTWCTRAWWTLDSVLPASPRWCSCFTVILVYFLSIAHVILSKGSNLSHKCDMIS